MAQAIVFTCASVITCSYIDCFHARSSSSMPATDYSNY